ncbi:MAG: superoxide dismutase [Bacteroidetes bacterium]|nr:superoxide dismutase [Bacteroidota bacterium]
MENNRRDFLKKGALLGLTSLGLTLVGKTRIDAIEDLIEKASDGGKYTLPALPYAYDALEPFIDKMTMEIHHTKHHQAYVDKMNAELNNPENIKLIGSPQTFEAIFKVASKVTPALRNNAGGHYNHSMFWQLMKPNPKADENKPTEKLAQLIARDFKSFDDFKKEFSEKALKIFGSGWCWLILQKDTLKIITTPNQDNPLMDNAPEQGKPILALDVWEHAYYLKYQNKRVDYINNWWNVVNWNTAANHLNG